MQLIPVLETCQKHNNLSETLLSFPIKVELALQELKAQEHICALQVLYSMESNFHVSRSSDCDTATHIAKTLT